MGRRFGLLGHKISYSLSPIIHEVIYRKLNLDAKYELIDIPENELDEKIHEIFDTYEGFNVTIPHKVRIVRYLNKLSPEAEITGAVNTVRSRDREGFNTDVYGVIYSVRHFGVEREISGKVALVLGAGGAARAAVYALYKLNVAEIIACNRSEQRALELVHHFSNFGINVKVKPWEERGHVARQVDIIVNCTPVGTLSWESPLPDDVFRRGQIVIDLVYRPRKTKLLHDAERQGAVIVDGLTILIYQALEADKIWLGVDVVNSEMFRLVEQHVVKYAE